jgi:hypothetical protein
MNWTSLIGPAVIAAAVSGIVSIIGFRITASTNKLMHEKRLETDVRLAEQKVAADVRLAEKKVALDRELDLWKKRVAVAEEVLLEFYRGRDIVSWIRSPMAYGYESEARAGREGESEALRRARDAYFPHLKRLQDNSEFFANIRARRYRVIALFGEAAVSPFDRLHAVHSKLIVSAQMLQEEDTHDRVPAAIEHKRRLEAAIWEGLEDGDSIKVEMGGIVEAAEVIFRPAIVSLPATP